MKTADLKILDHVPLGIFIIDKDYRIVFWNFCLVDWLSYSKEEVLNSSVFSIFPDLASPVYTSRLNGLFCGGPPVILSSQLHPALFDVSRRKNRQKQVYHVTVSSVPISKPEKFYALFALENVTSFSKKVSETRRLQQLSVDLLKELNHRVKNHLSMISGFMFLQRKYIQDPKALEILESLRYRIDSISLLHEKLYQHFEHGKMDLNEYFIELLDKISKGLERKGLTLNYKAMDEPLIINGDKGLYVGLIVTELVTNALKHAYAELEPGSIYVHMKFIDEKSIHIEVHDNGQGLPEDFKLNSGESLGNKLLSSLVSALKGELVFYNENGAKFLLKLSYEKLKQE